MYTDIIRGHLTLLEDPPRYSLRLTGTSAPTVEVDLVCS